MEEEEIKGQERRNEGGKKNKRRNDLDARGSTDIIRRFNHRSPGLSQTAGFITDRRVYHTTSLSRKVLNGLEISF